MEKEIKTELMKDSALYKMLSKLTNDMSEQKMKMSGEFSVDEILLGNEARYKKALEMEALNKKIMEDLNKSINLVLTELNERGR